MGPVDSTSERQDGHHARCQ